MSDIKTLRDEWNAAQKQLRPLLSNPARHAEILDLILNQHAVLHSAKIAPNIPWSYEDLLLDELSENVFRRLLPKEEHTIAWHIWHIARIEDITMHILTAGEEQIFASQGWRERLKAKAGDTGNAMTRQEIETLSETIDLQALRAYRLAVGKETRQIISSIPAEAINTIVDPPRLQRVLDVGAVLPEAMDVIDYWGKRTIGGLLGMPVSRHMIIHLNQAYTLKEKMHR
ncbi:MAG TPA: DinB family protein [Anaerolineales bacterium]|nr:DinB family protein [Anaerolineales bacterium]